MPDVTVYVDPEDVLEDLSDEELIEELERRGLEVGSQFKEEFGKAYQLHVQGKPELSHAVLHEIMLVAVNRIT